MTLSSDSRCHFKENPTFSFRSHQLVTHNSWPRPTVFEAAATNSLLRKKPMECVRVCVCVCDGLSTCKQAGCSLAGWLSDTCFLCSLTQARCRLTSQTTARTLSDTSGSTENQSLRTINPEHRGVTVSTPEYGRRIACCVPTANVSEFACEQLDRWITGFWTCSLIHQADLQQRALSIGPMVCELQDQTVSVTDKWMRYENEHLAARSCWPARTVQWELDTTADDNGIVFTLKEENSAAKKKSVKWMTKS